MTKSFEDTLGIQFKMESEKKLFGGSIYDMAHKFPSIYIKSIKDKENDESYDCYNEESFIKHVELLHNLIDTCGKDISLYFAKTYKLYEINDDTQNTDHNKAIVTFCTDALAHLSLTLNQSGKLLDKVNDLKNNKEIYKKTKLTIDEIKYFYTIDGTEYCFIAMVLMNLFYYYTTVFNFILHRSYLDNEVITNIRETLSFIVSNEFDSIRRIFKVIECYKEIETKPTFH